MTACGGYEGSGGVTDRGLVACRRGGLPGVVLSSGCRGTAVYTAGGLSGGAGGLASRRCGVGPWLAWRGGAGLRGPCCRAGGPWWAAASRWSAAGRGGGGSGPCQGSAARRIDPWLCRSSGGYGRRGGAPRVLCSRVRAWGVWEVSDLRVRWGLNHSSVPSCVRGRQPVHHRPNRAPPARWPGPGVTAHGGCPLPGALVCEGHGGVCARAQGGHGLLGQKGPALSPGRRCCGGGGGGRGKAALRALRRDLLGCRVPRGPSRLFEALLVCVRGRRAF